MTPLRKIYRREKAGFILPFSKVLLFSHLILISTVSMPQQLIKDINRDENPEVNEYGEALDVNGTLYFTSGGDLWKTTGSRETSSLVRKFSGIAFLTRLDNLLYFNANDGSGEELWKSNGTPQGTVKIKDIRPGASGSAPTLLTVSDGVLFFVADDGVHGKELWKSDGTSGGTTLVKDIMQVAGSSNPSSLTDVNGILFFVANNTTQGYELWKTDGTAAGTSVVKDIRPESRKSSFPKSLTNVNGVLFFTAEDAEAGRELWKSDGTSAGTIIVKDIFKGSTGSSVTNLVAVNKTLFFSANDAVHGQELWKSDGRTSGTVLVKDLTPGPHGSYSRAFWYEKMDNFTNVNGKLYFMAYKGNEYFFWKSDGTESGTVPILAMEMEIFLPPKLLPGFTTLNNNVYFYFPTNKHYPVTYLDLMKEDPTGKITTLSSLALWDYYDSRNQILVRSGNYLYMTGRQNVRSGYALFKTDGISGAQKVIDTYSLKDQSSFPDQFLNIQGTVYFTTVAGSPVLADESQSLWKTDGTSAGTTKLAEHYSISGLTNVNGGLYFVVFQNDGSDIYKSDGTPQGTAKLGLAAPPGTYFLSNLTYAGNKLFFTWSSYPGQPVYLWVYDGVTSAQLGVFDYASNFNVLGGKLYYEASTSWSGSELWRSDGTIGGTVVVKDIIPGTAGSSPASITVYNNLLFFSANDGVNGFELWRSNGTASGTFMLKNLSATNATNNQGGIQHFKTVANVLYFTTTENSISKLWKTNGTAGGTVLLKEIPPPAWLLDGGKQLLLITESGTSYDLWKSNGVAAETGFVANLPSFYSYDRRFDSFTLDSVAYFSNAQNLWRSDGTSCGTFTVPLSVVGFPFDHIGNEIIFGGADRLIGTELFKIDATDIVDPCTPFAAVAQRSPAWNMPDSAISSYPNPFVEAFQLKLSGDEGEEYAVTIYDKNSVVIESHMYHAFKDPYWLGSDWPAGLYLMKIKNRDKITITRIFKNQ